MNYYKARTAMRENAGATQMLNNTIKASSLESLHNQLQNLEATISRLVRLQQDMPKGEHRNRLLEEISCLDVILEVMGKAVNDEI